MYNEQNLEIAKSGRSGGSTVATGSWPPAPALPECCRSRCAARVVLLVQYPELLGPPPRRMARAARAAAVRAAPLMPPPHTLRLATVHPAPSHHRPPVHAAAFAATRAAR
jgi:hypothetical protein